MIGKKSTWTLFEHSISFDGKVSVARRNSPPKSRLKKRNRHFSKLSKEFFPKEMKEMNTLEKETQRSKKNQLVLDLWKFLTQRESWSFGYLNLPLEEENEEEISKVPCLLSLQTDLEEEDPPGFPLSLPKLQRQEKVPKGNLSASLFLEILQDEIRSRLKAMNRGGTNE